MKKKLDTRFPAARIKKIMQADEDVGKIAMAVPVLVSKALELFLQDLCDHTYDITVQRGAKTMNSLHLKHCIHGFSMFDFLKDVVSKVPDYSNPDAPDDRIALKRRKSIVDEHHDSDEESKKSRLQEVSHASNSGRGRGRGRGKGRGRGRPPLEREPPHHHEMEAEPSTSFEPSSKPSKIEVPNNMDDDSDAQIDPMKESPSVGDGGDPAIRNFDLNADVTENPDTATNTVAATQDEPPVESKEEELVSEVDGMAIDPHQIAQFNPRVEDEDYDEE